MKKFLALCLALVMVFGLVSVPKATTADGNYIQKMKIKGDSHEMHPGETMQLNVTVTDPTIPEGCNIEPDEFYSDMVSWASSDPALATVTPDYSQSMMGFKATVTAKEGAEGEVVITAYVGENIDDPFALAEYKINITPKGNTITLGYQLNVVIKNDPVPEGCTATTDPAPGTVAAGTKVNVLIRKPDTYRAIVTVDPKPVWTNEAKYEFTMPKADTTVTVEFVENNPSEYYSLTVTQEGKGKYSVNPEKEYYALGDEAIISFTPEKGWTVKEVTVNGKPVDPGSGSQFKWAVKIEGDTEVHVKFVEIQSSEKHNVYVKIKNPDCGNAYADPSKDVAMNEGVTLYFEPKLGYKAEYTIEPEGLKTDGNYTFMMPDRDVTVYVEFVKSVIPFGNKLDVKVINEEGGEAVTNPTAPCTLAAGTKVSLTVTPKPGYKSIVTTKPEIKWTAVNKSMNGGIYYAFDMPDEDTTITVEFVKKVEKEHSVELKVTGGIGYVATAGMTEQSKVQFLEAVPVGQKVTSSWESGTKVPVSAKFNGKEIDVNDIIVKEYSATRTTYYYYFNMPDEDVLIEIVFADQVPEHEFWLEPETVDIYVGESATITAWYSYKGGEPVKLSPADLGMFSAQDNDGVIKFDDKTGMLNALKPGYCSITARYTPDGTGMKMHGNVNVIVRPAARYYIYPNPLDITVGDTFNLDEDVEVWYGFSEGGYQKVTADYWCVVKNEGVLKVEERENHIVTATELIGLAEGTAILRAFYTTEHDELISTDLTVNVAPAPAPEYDAFVYRFSGYLGDIQELRYIFVVKNEYTDKLKLSLTVGGDPRNQVTTAEQFYMSRRACWMFDTLPAGQAYDDPNYTSYYIRVKVFAKQYDKQCAFTVTSGDYTLNVRSYQNDTYNVPGVVDTVLSYSMVDLMNLYYQINQNRLGEKWTELAEAMAAYAVKLRAVE